jgi:hypothetical protein
LADAIGGAEVDTDEEEDMDEDLKKRKDKARIDYAKALHVPDGGYDEEEDCLNAEDESYREALESMGKESDKKRELYLSGEPVDDEDDDEYTFSSPIESLDVTQFFIDMFQSISARDPQMVSSLQENLDQEDKDRLTELIKKAAEKRAITE